MNIELRLLRHACALAEQRHFGRAAKALRMSQPALSRSITQLEHRIGTRLFERTPVGAEPTDAGRLLLERAAELLTLAGDLSREISALSGLDTGELLVGAGTYPAEMLVGTTLTGLLRQRPGVRVRIVVENVQNLVPLLRRRELNVVIGDATSLGDDSEFHVTPLATRQGYFIVRRGHPLLQVKTPSLADVLRFPLASTSRLTSRLLAPLLAAARQSGAHVAGETISVPSVACESLSMMKTIAAGSDAIAVLPLGVVAAEIRDGTLTALPLVEDWLKGNFAIIRLARRTPPACFADFVQLLLDADAELTRVSDAIEQQLAGDRDRAGSAIAAADRGRPRRDTFPKPKARHRILS